MGMMIPKRKNRDFTKGLCLDCTKTHNVAGFDFQRTGSEFEKGNNEKRVPKHDSRWESKIHYYSKIFLTLVFILENC